MVAGQPVPQGSKRIGRNRKTGRPVILDDPRGLQGWRTLLAWAALRARQQAGIRSPFTGAVEVTAVFYVTRPTSVRRRRYPHVKPDLDKLGRALFDALSRTLVRDDAQIIKATLSKVYVTHDHPTPPGVSARVREVDDVTPA